MSQWRPWGYFAACNADIADELGARVEKINQKEGVEAEVFKPTMLREAGCLTAADMSQLGKYIIGTTSKLTTKEISDFIGDLVKRRMVTWHVMAPDNPHIPPHASM